MLLRYPLLALALLLSTTAAGAKPRSAAIADLHLREPIGSQLIDKIRSDLSLSGYTLNEKAPLLRGLQGQIASTPGIAEATEHLQGARDSYESFKLDQALAQLDAVDAILHKSATEDQERNLLAQRYLLAGLIRVAQSQRDKAINNFRLAHRLQPGLSELDAGSHRPSVVSMYADAVRQNRGARTTKLIRDWKPSAAQLYADGQLVTLKSKLTQGPHILSLKAEGHESMGVAVSLSGTTTHSLQLKELSQDEWLRSLRVAAAEDPEDTARLAALAQLVAVDTLVFVRGGSSGPTAALYDRASASLSAWVQIGSVRWQSILTRNESAGSVSGLSGSAQNQPEEPWFKQWWGGGLIVGGTAVVGAAIYFALSASDSSDTEATIDQWCFGSCN